ncbi:MAG: DUF1800 family protein [Planctomycetota bacterium]
MLVVALVLPACGGSSGPAFAVTALALDGDPPGPAAGGVPAGGETLRIYGRGFENGASVLFDTTQAPTITFVSATEILVTTPPMPEGAVDIVVVNPSGEEARVPAAFYFGTPPMILTVNAAEGPARGTAKAPILVTTTMEISGIDFRDGAQVLVDGAAVPTTFVSATTVRFAVTAPSWEANAAVTVRNPEGIAETRADAFFYTAEFNLTPQPGAMTEGQLRHLLRRAGFDASESMLAARRGLSLDATAQVNWLLDVRRDATLQQVEADAFALYGAEPPPGPINGRTNQEWWIHLIRHNPFPLQERLAWFLHDHFATSQDVFGEDERWWMHEQIQLFRRFSLPAADGGLDFNWQALLVEVCKDQAMLEWLDGNDSRRGSPNENFAREFWELFTLGEGNGYTQLDIEEASRAFTGFRDEQPDPLPYEIVVYHVDRHDADPKTIFGVTGNFGYDSVAPYHESGAGIQTDPRDTGGGVVALTLRERPLEASTFICRKLAAFLLYDDPPQVVVDELANTLRLSNWNLKPMLWQLLRSRAMYSQRAMKSQIKSPTEFIFEFLRATDIDYAPNRIRDTLNALRQEPMEPPDVDGWPHGNAWMGGQAMLERINFVRDVVRDLDSTPADIHPLVPPAGQRSPAQLVAHLSDLVGVDLSDEAREELESYVTTTLSGDQVVPFAFDPTDGTHLRMKARGLLYLIATYHDGHRQ